MNRTAQYLAVIYRLSREEGEPLPPGRVAETLDRSPSATTEMVQRLESEGLVEREPYDGVRLTDFGRERAAERYRTYGRSGRSSGRCSNSTLPSARPSNSSGR